MLLPRFAAAQKHAQMENAFWARALAAAKKKKMREKLKPR